MNFGPAHPAAHGVFRLLLGMNHEIVVTCAHSQGLLWRCTESLLEYRNLALNSGYFARLDYVAYVAQELGFNPEKSAHGTSSGTVANLLVRAIS